MPTNSNTNQTRETINLPDRTESNGKEQNPPPAEVPFEDDTPRETPPKA